MEWNRERPNRWAMISRAVSGLTDGVAAEAVQYSEEKKRPQDSFMVAVGDGWGAGSLRR